MTQSKYSGRRLVLVLLAACATLGGCGEEGSDSAGPILMPGQNRPVGIATPAAHVSLSPILHWRPSGATGDQVVYDFYFDTSADPARVVDNLSDTSISLGPLMPGTKYYWAVAARINGAFTGRSDIYSFTTRTGITYPVAVGNRWEYRRERTALSTEFGYYVISIPRTDTGWHVEPVYVFEETWFDFEQDSLGGATTWYHVNAQGLYRAGYEGQGGVNPVRALDPYRYRFAGDEFRSVGELLGHVDAGLPASSRATGSIVIEDPPKLMLKYPIEVGSQWVVCTDDPWRIEKLVGSYEIIDVPAGRFGCFVIQWLEDLNHDGEFNDNLVFEDFIAEQGLVRRSIQMLNVLVMDEFGNEIGRIDIIDTFDLVASETQ